VHAQLGEVEGEQRGMARELARWNADLRKLAQQPHGDDSPVTARLADLQERIQALEARAAVLSDQAQALKGGIVSPEEIARVLGDFDRLWESLTPREQCRVIQLLVQRVEYDGGTGKVSITFHPTGIKSLGAKLARQESAA
jgi:site-specific DNA recombinase